MSLLKGPYIVVLLIAFGVGPFGSGTLAAAAGYGAQQVSHDGSYEFPAPGMGCPPKFPARIKDKNPRARHRLVPSGAAEVRVCAFGGYESDETQGMLTAQRVAGPSRTRWFSRAFDMLSPNPPGTYSCGLGSGRRFLFFFNYANEPEVPVLVDLRTCPRTRNGALTTSFGAPRFLIREIERFLGPA